MSPGADEMRSATSRCSISTSRSGRGGAPRKRCRIGLVMWYGTLATTSYGGTINSAIF